MEIYVQSSEHKMATEGGGKRAAECLPQMCFSVLLTVGSVCTLWWSSPWWASHYCLVFTCCIVHRTYTILGGASRLASSFHIFRYSWNQNQGNFFFFTKRHTMRLVISLIFLQIINKIFKKIMKRAFSSQVKKHTYTNLHLFWGLSLFMKFQYIDLFWS